MTSGISIHFIGSVLSCVYKIFAVDNTSSLVWEGSVLFCGLARWLAEYLTADWLPQIFFFKYFFPRFCNPFFNHPVSIALANPVHYLCLYQLASWESRERNHVFLRDMTRQPAASYHMTVETFTRGSVARGRNHVILLSSQSRPLCALLTSWRRYSAHDFAYLLWIGGSWEPPGDTGRACKLHTETPFCRPHPRYGHRWHGGADTSHSAHSVLCGNRTQNVLAVRRQCYHYATVPPLVLHFRLP